MRHDLFSEKEIGRFQSGKDSSIKEIACALGRSAISSVQLRCKGTGREAHRFASLWTQALRTHCPHVAIIINDRVELASALEADGVHVGQEDTPVAVCRHILGPDKIVGLSTHSMEEVLAANQNGVDYIGFGPVFSTRSKPDACPPQGLFRLEEVCRTAHVPVVAIGGIQQPQIKAIAEAKNSATAMISSLWGKDWRQHLERASRLWASTANM